ncbi:MAG: ABC transporter substrate-binding protein [Hyphomicrobiales bacterium]|nr:ABC transporter substrate-binding protein [Hyphomicrobiales bacterium]
MKRREFIKLVGGATMWPLAARAQNRPMRRIGLLSGGAAGDLGIAAGVAAFNAALDELGWIEGRNVQIDYRFAAADVERMHAMAKELVALQPDVIVAQTTPSVAALQRQTSTIPIVFVFVSDPVGGGFVASLARPGGNITGFINIEASLGGKWIEILKDIAPRVARAALMFNPETAPYFAFYQQTFEAAARSNGIEPIAAPVRSAVDIEHAFESLVGRPDTGLVLMPDIFMTTRDYLDLINSLAERHRVPTIYPYRFMVAAGGLISYGNDAIDLWRRVPTYVDRILKGAKPADLPVQLPTKFEMTINLKTAKALGFNIPATMLGRADEVIE